MTHPTPSAASSAAALSATSSRRARLKNATRDIHERLDKRIMDFQPFADRERYTAFLQTQYALHRDVQALFVDPALNALLPQLAERSRLALIEQDLHDLGAAPPSDQPAPSFTFAAQHHVPTALGWLYTVEGSNIGAAFLLKAAGRLGLDGRLGARHLAPHADGRAAHWRDFIAQLDDVHLSPEEENHVDAGARAAFAAALTHVERHCTASRQAGR